ncbi:anti-sigma regulatory factor (Ser/Thr protein kinase) [Solirubrobacter pauli]|uniref:Anti-sigma regulatory factor (Ser/Thr protein kinase) n=1 Tax=Solirubrobacter pauli TaxID=166793 RepID=A0A660L2V3_9ACTN|nr:ATP-binding protein [Solirubrobacter pauli]RKQ87202.1 anti-sigma regulatory factor (Ser/Thr protein kinase) [Solirubrobacter pauli]
MALTTPVRLRVDDPSGVAPVRRAVEEIADALGLDEVRRGEASIVVTELATNLIRHARGGEIVLRINRVGDASIDVIATDRGPGIPNFARARGDGFSTGGGPGNGLGAIGRMSAAMDVHSGAGQGAVVLARLGTPEPEPPVDGIALAMEGETSCGDAWGHVVDGEQVTILLMDGLGHGDDAATAANAAVRELRPGLDPNGLLMRIHGALRATRGAAGAVAYWNRRTGALQYAGIGNIAASIVVAGESRSLVSMPGILGHGIQRPRVFDYELPPGGLLVMHSDGLRSGWDLAAYPGIVRRDPLATAAVLIRDFERGRDDVSVVVARA